MRMGGPQSRSEGSGDKKKIPDIFVFVILLFKSLIILVVKYTLIFSKLLRRKCMALLDPQFTLGTGWNVSSTTKWTRHVH
jgi:hypothetical protein